MKVKSLSLVRLLATPWTAAHQAPPSRGFSRQECWSGVSLPSPKSEFTDHLIQFLSFTERKVKVKTGWTTCSHNHQGQTHAQRPFYPTTRLFLTRQSSCRAMAPSVCAYTRAWSTLTTAGHFTAPTGRE